MSLREKLVSYHETVEQMKELNDEYELLLKLGAKYSNSVTIEDIIQSLDGRMVQLIDRTQRLKELTGHIAGSSPRIVLRSIINDESIVLSDLADQFRVSLAELDDAIEVNQGKPLVNQVLTHFGLPLEYYRKFIQ
ncbi:hypothetical protein [Paenibacillus amylolyticus]|uniref:hypothetical protein n=2 Tax=Paenibacillus TaxID=44249 RepID=UPI00339A43A7